MSPKPKDECLYKSGKRRRHKQRGAEGYGTVKAEIGMMEQEEAGRSEKGSSPREDGMCKCPGVRERAVF